MTEKKTEKKPRKPRAKAADLQKQIDDLSCRLDIVQKAHADALQNYGAAVEVASKYKSAANRMLVNRAIDKIRLLDAVLTFFMNKLDIDKESIEARLALLQKQRLESSGTANR